MSSHLPFKSLSSYVYDKNTYKYFSLVNHHSNELHRYQSFNSEPEFYGDLVYKFKKLRGINDFSFQFRKIITRYRRIGYNLNVMRQSACLAFNPVMVDGP